VDEYAKGHGVGVPTFPQVRTERGRRSGERSVRGHRTSGGPLPPNATLPSNVAVIDGDGSASPLGFHYPGIGVVEPNPPSTQLPNPGDNVDGLDAASLLRSRRAACSSRSTARSPIRRAACLRLVRRIKRA
jgi:hypothetical protein